MLDRVIAVSVEELIKKVSEQNERISRIEELLKIKQEDTSS